MCFGSAPQAPPPPAPPAAAPIQQAKLATVKRGAPKRVGSKKRARGTGRSSMIIERPTGVNMNKGGVGVYS
jgi:hypothetical protein